MSYMSAGSPAGWTSPTLPLLEENDYIVLTEMQRAWVSAIFAVGAAIGSVIVGFVVHLLGHRVSLMLTAVLYLAGWAALAAARSAEFLYVGRIILGICIGISFSVTPTYIGEIAQPKIRGALGALTQFFASFGVLFEYLVGPWSSYVALAVSSGVIPALLLVGLFFIPDSPYQLLRRGKNSEAKKAYLWLRGLNDLDDNEFHVIEEEVTHMLKQKSSMKDLVANRATVKALLLSQGLSMFQQMTGITAVLFYAQEILAMGVKSLSPSIAAIIVGVVTQVTSAITPFVVERTGRRAMLMMSAGGMCLSQLVLGVFFYCTNTGTDTSKYGFVPIICLIFCISGYSTGLGPLMWVVSSELFAPLVRSKAASLTSCTCWVVCFIVTFFFQDLIDMLGNHVVFWIFAAFCFSAGLFVYFLLPETRGKTLQEIQDLLGD